MINKIKKFFSATIIFTLSNTSFQPLYAYPEFDKASFDCDVELFPSLRRMNDIDLEDAQTNTTIAQSNDLDVISQFALMSLKPLIGAVSLVKQGVRFALENPGKAITMGLLLQARTATSTLSLSDLTAAQGFNISGAAADDHSGSSVSSGWDFNGDGLNDLIIGAPGANSLAGKSYVIYGTNSNLSLISLNSLNPLQGFTITGAAAGDSSGSSVFSAGDFNGDGFNDLIIGAPGANSGVGESYVIYGSKTPSSISLSSLTPTQGLIIYGASVGSNSLGGESGSSVSSAGDFNGDGFNDLIIGASEANSFAGDSYIIYGTNSYPSSIRLSSLTPTQGFTITGAAAGDSSGKSVSSAGDFNGDSLNDIIIGAPGANNQAGNSYLIYGTNSYPSSLSLSSLTAAQGLIIYGGYSTVGYDYSGSAVSSAGDFNGDSFNDIIIGAPFANNRIGDSYVIYGTNSYPSSISLSSLTAAQGFAIYGAVAGDSSGSSVSSAGDFNGDGLNDIIIGAPFANSNAGSSYVIYGSKTPSSISLSSLTPTQGLIIYGAAAGDWSGGSVSSAGDFNGDSLNDLIIGAYGANSDAGNSYLIYGAPPVPSPSPSPVQSSSETRENGKSWKTYAAIGGGIGGAVVAGAIGGIIVKKFCCSKKTGYSHIND